MPPIEVIINAAGGSFVENDTAETVRLAFSDADLDVNIHLASNGDEVSALAEKAASGDSEIIVAGGGDGTLALVANAVFKAGKTFGILPLGTLNHFSKDIGIPQDIPAAVAVIARGHTQHVDLGEVNGRIFINNSSIGLYPRIVRHREAQQERLGRGKWYAALLGAVRVFRRSPFYRVRFSLGGQSFLRKVPFVFVGNNLYEMDLYNIGSRQNLDRGVLGVYFLHRGGRWGVLELLFRTLIGRLKQWRDFEEIDTEAITIKTRKKEILVALDGEVVLMETPLEYRIVPKSLKIITPEPVSNA
ncbi:diacylglycerol kinase family protein [soil metagenome]